jgi:hypothetical protein
MKALLETYTFSPSTKQVTFITTQTITLERLLLITNVTTNQIIYNFADPSAGGTITNNVLTLNYNTTSMSASNKLQIYIDNGYSPSSDETLQLVNEQTELMRRMTKLLEPSANQNVFGLQKIEVTTMTPQIVNQHNITFLGGAANSNLSAAEAMFFPQSRQSYALIRQNLIFS